MRHTLKEDNPLFNSNNVSGRTAISDEPRKRYTITKDSFKPGEPGPDKYRRIGAGSEEYPTFEFAVDLLKKGLPVGAVVGGLTEESERAFAAYSPTGYAVARTAAGLVPFGWNLFPDAKREFMNQSVGGKAFDVVLDASVVLPVTRLFRGAKSLVHTPGATAAVAYKGKNPLKSLSVAEESIPIGSRFESVSLLEKVKTKWKMPDDEAKALLEQNASPGLWSGTYGRSGGAIPRELSPGFTARFTPGGKLTKKTKRKLDYWTKTPLGIQRADHYRDVWKGMVKESTGKEISLQGMFEYQMKKYVKYGEEAKFSLNGSSGKLMANLIVQALDNPGHIQKVLNIGYQWITPNIILPARKVFGSGSAVFDTMTRFENIKSLYGKANKYKLQQITNFQKLLVDAGMGTFKTKGKGEAKRIVGFKKGKELTKDRWKLYGTAAKEIDRMTSLDMGEQAVANYINANTDDVVRKLLFNVHTPFHDDLYKDFALLRIPQILTDKGLSRQGLAEFKILWESESGLASKISTLFSPKYDPAKRDKNALMQAFLGEVRKKVQPSWFDAKSPKQMQYKFNSALNELTSSTKGKANFPNYLDNYTMRTSKVKAGLTGMRSKALGAKHAQFVHARTLEEGVEQVGDIAQIVESRVASQSRELFIKPYLGKELAAVSQMPKSYRNYFDYWLSRMDGSPAEIDAAVGQWLTSNMSGLTRLFGRSEVWDARRVQRLGRLVNDMAYLGGIAYKPYSAIRNMFQPLLTVPTDMGGIKDMYWLLKGYKRGTQHGTQEYIKRIGAIAEYTEELAMSSGLPKFGPKALGKQLPTMEGIRDVGMWMFKKSDEFNRYVTGGAALSKWEAMATKYMQPGVKYAPEKFMKKMKFQGRDANVRRALEDILDKLPKSPGKAQEIDGILNRAKDKFVSDVIADTQWLYGVAEAPVIAGRWGVISKTGVIFQSWWMNYAAALEKWFMRTGDVSTKMDRAFTALASSAVAGELMVHGAGFKGGQAAKTTFGGPFPTEVNEFMVPPTWAPLYHGLGVVGNLGKLEPEAAKKRFSAMTRSMAFFAPGGLQAMKSYRGAKKGGFEGLARSIINYHGGTGERFLIGR